MKFDTDWLKEEPLAKIIAKYLEEHPDRSINESSEIKQKEDFLHNHPSLEKTLLNTEDEPGLNKDFVIVDKKDWERVHKILYNNILFPNSEEHQKGVSGNIPIDVEFIPPETDFVCGIKHDVDKPRFDLIPADALEEVAKVYTVGAKKYGDRNWEKGLSYGRLFGALLRHAWAWWRGEKNDKENKLHHLSSVVFCALALLHYELNFEKFKEFDDRILANKNNDIANSCSNTSCKICPEKDFCDDFR